jgi:SAM-dependent methyltransferase
MRSIHCPICDESTSRFLIHEKPQARLYQLPSPPEQDVPQFTQDLKWWLCRRCGHSFIDPTPPSEVLTAFYDAGYGEYTSPLESGGLTASQADGPLEFIHNYLYPSAKVVEVGGFDGFTLHSIKDEVSEVTLIEPSRVGADIAERNGLTVIREPLSSELATELSGKFDIVICRHVVEHVLNPHEFLSQLAQIVSDDGHLIVETPGLSQMLEIGFVRAVMLQHVHIFSEQSLDISLARVGMTRTDSANATTSAMIRSYSRNGASEKLIGLAESFKSTIKAQSERLSTIVARWNSAHYRIWIWGAGTAAGEIFQDYGLSPDQFSGFIDSNSGKSGHQFVGLPGLDIHTPSEAETIGVDAVLIASYSVDEIKSTISDLGWAIEIDDIYSQ